MPGVDRRTLLIGGGAGVGLVVAFLAWPRREGSPLRPADGEGVLGPYLRIAPDGRTTLAVPQVEVGQGIWTGLAQIAADELGAAWEMMSVEPAPSAPIYANRLIATEYRLSTRVTAGATSVRAFEAPLREAAATARAMLCAEAADRWGVSAAECDTDSGFVTHEGKRLGFGVIAAGAGGRKPLQTAPLRAPGTGKLAGQPLPRLELPAKSDGTLRFAGDVRLPRMLFASARIAPPGGRLEGHRPGDHGARIVRREGWIAAVGETHWAADRALTRAAPRFSGPASADRAAIDARLAELMDGGKAERLFERGDYEAVTSESRPLAATYSIAPAPHHSLEPPAAAARFTGDRLEVWAATQIPDLARAAAARAAGMGEREVTLYPMPIGDGSGRAVELEAIEIAVALAREAGRPVSLTLPPATAQNQDPGRAPMLARLSALPTPEATLSSWSARIVGASGLGSSLARAVAGPVPTFAPVAATPPYGIGAIRIDAVSAELPIRAGYMRGGEAAPIIFATESFIDELARALGAEPLAFRIGMLGGAPRLAAVLTTAATIGGWDGGARGSSMGLACASLDGSHIALLAEAGLGPDQRVKVSRLVAAVDAGRIVNPNLVRQQVEGGLLAALAAATVPAPEFVAGMPRAMPMRGRGFERLHEVPQVEVELIRSNEASGGVSGLGMAVLAPAVANAIAAATGRRLRDLPFDPMAA